MLALALLIAACDPVDADEKMLVVVQASAPELEPKMTLARALVLSSVPFPIVNEAPAREAQNAESGIEDRRAAIERGDEKLAQAERSFAELEAQGALELLAEMTPRLVASQVDPRALQLLARGHLLAASIFLALGRPDAAGARLERVLDLAPELRPENDLRLLGALEAARSLRARRSLGDLDIELVGTATAGRVFIDGQLVGLLPGRLPPVPAGRHLLRVSAPGHRSAVGTVLIRAGTQQTERIRLSPDVELLEIQRLGTRLAGGGSIEVTQSKLTTRAAVSRTLVASLAPSPRRDEGQLGYRVLLDLERAGRRAVEGFDAARVGEALRELASCTPSSSSPDWLAAAPALAGRPPRPSTQRPAPRPDTSPWLWAAAALLVVGTAGALAAAHGSSAPPEDLRIELVPRP